jgi:hypothetical protein
MMKESWMEGDAENGTALSSRQDRVGKVASSAHDTPATHEYDFYSWASFHDETRQWRMHPTG